MIVKLETLLIYSHKLRFAKLARAGGYFFPGLGLNIPRDASLGLIQHEYGHFLQYKKIGFSSYVFNVAIPSVYDMAKGKLGLSDSWAHDRLKPELEATTLAHDYFGKSSKLNNGDYPTFYTDPILQPKSTNQQINDIKSQFSAFSTWDGRPW